MFEASEFKSIQADLARLKCQLLGVKLDLKFRRWVGSIKAGFNPDQPRDERGRWTDSDASDEPEEQEQQPFPANKVSAVFADIASMPLAERMRQLLGGNDANGVEPYLQTIGATITYDTAHTGLPTIDQTTEKLSDALIKAMDRVQFIPDQTPQAYGVAVHVSFAGIVRADDLPGIGRDGVEQSFLMTDVVTYGVAGSVRTDVVLRDVTGDVIAIYDVKTGGAVLSASRADYLREHTGALPNTPVIELHFLRGSSLKHEQVAEDIRIAAAPIAGHRSLREIPRRCSHGVSCEGLSFRSHCAPGPNAVVARRHAALPPANRSSDPQLQHRHSRRP